MAKTPLEQERDDRLRALALDKAVQWTSTGWNGTAEATSKIAQRFYDFLTGTDPNEGDKS